MKALVALLGFLANPGTLMNPQGVNTAAIILQDAIATEADEGLTTEGGDYIVTEESSL